MQHNRYSRTIFLALTVAFAGAGCEIAERPPEARRLRPGLEEKAAPLIPADAPFEAVNDLVRDPYRDPLPTDTLVARQVQLGYEIVRNTPEHAGDYIGNTLSCANCHLNAGQRDRALPFIGVAATFPQYRPREARLSSLEDRVRGCFERSMNGTPPPYDSEELLAVSAYITWLSEGQPVGEDPAWRGRNRIASEALIPIAQLDVARGEQQYLQHCAACHGLDGQGVDMGIAQAGPLWGPDSWNDGAGLSRVYTLAGYIRYAMPLTSPGSLTDEEALQISAYLTSKPRPEFATKAADYPKGDVPVDAVYYPRYERNPLLR